MIKRAFGRVGRLLKLRADTRDLPRLFGATYDLTMQTWQKPATDRSAVNGNSRSAESAASHCGASEHPEILRTSQLCTPEEVRRMRFAEGTEPSTRTVVRAFPDSNRVQVFLVDESAVQSTMPRLPASRR